MPFLNVANMKISMPQALKGSQFSTKWRNLATMRCGDAKVVSTQTENAKWEAKPDMSHNKPNKDTPIGNVISVSTVSAFFSCKCPLNP